jgi:hypothetical protein
MAKILVSLVSDQTLPNVELIKEFQESIYSYVFIITKKMHRQYEWIINTTQIKEYDKIEIDPFDRADIEQKLNGYPFGDDEIILNITGGTKLTLLIVNDFFKNIGATIFYVTGQNKEYIKVFPNRGKQKLTFEKKLTLREYLSAYGFEYTDTGCYLKQDQASRIFEYFDKNNLSEVFEFIEPVRLNRGKSMDIDNPNLLNFLNIVNYQFDKKLNKKDTKYLSGDWLEEFVYFKVKEELNLSDDEIATGINIKKEGIDNEIDVIFIYNHQLFIIECKTSVIDKRKVKLVRDGKEIEEIKEIKLLGEIIYKSDALRNSFGLFANTSILTTEELRNEDSSPKNGYEGHFQRMKLSRIKLITKSDLIESTSISKLLNIN